MNSVNGDAPKSNSGNGIDGGEILVHRTKRNKNFTTIPNEIFDDRRLGGMALAILTYILRRPPHWRVRRTEVMVRFGIGKDAYYSAWNELKAAGYVRVSRKGRKVRIHVFDQPQAGPNSGQPGISSFRKTRNLVNSGKPGHIVKLELVSSNTDSPSKTEEEESPSAILSGPVEDTGPSDSAGPNSSQPSGTSSGPNSVTGGGAAQPSGQPAPYVYEQGPIKITRKEFADMERVYKNIPNLEAEIFSSTPWVTKRAAENGGDFMGPLTNVLKKADARYALLREKEERDAPEDIRSW
jgi:hypothetical protein